MAMCTTIVSIREKNIRHLYYGQPLNMFYRTSADYPNLDQLRIAKGEKELRENILKSAKQNYSGMELEPAPAFRCVSAAEAEEIGNRLYAGHRKKKSSNAKDGSDTNKNEKSQGMTTSNTPDNQAAVKFKQESHERDTSPPPPPGSTESSPTQQK